MAEHIGRTDLPRPVARAVRAATRQHPRESQVWWLAARCLRKTIRRGWAYKCYRRAAKLDPGNLDLNEETGLYAVSALTGSNEQRSGLFFLVKARTDPARRARLDPILFRFARPFPAMLAGLVAVGSVAGLLAGAAVVRRGDGVVGDPPPGLDPLTGPGVVTALVTVVAVVGLFWALIRPVGQFSAEILRRVLWPPRVIHALAELTALAGLVLTVVAVALSGSGDALDSYGAWAALAFLSTWVLMLFGLPPGMSVAAIGELIKNAVNR
jgi:hypothetical protein